MKTNMMMQVNFGGNVLHIEHLSKMGSLTDLWAIGNSYRRGKGLNPLRLDHYLTSPGLQEFVTEMEIDMGIFKSPESGDLEATDLYNKHPGTVPTIKSPLIRTKKGRYGGTWAHLYILIDAATHLDAKFKLEVYKIFVSGKLLEWRDMSGEAFKAMNLALDAAIDNVTTADYKWLAGLVASKVGVDVGEWNTATKEQLEVRSALESSICTLLKSGLVHSRSQLESAIGNLLK